MKINYQLSEFASYSIPIAETDIEQAKLIIKSFIVSHKIEDHVNLKIEKFDNRYFIGHDPGPCNFAWLFELVQALVDTLNVQKPIQIIWESEFLKERGRVIIKKDMEPQFYDPYFENVA